jgi:hypothetical protein
MPSVMVQSRDPGRDVRRLATLRSRDVDPIRCANLETL